MHGVVLEIIFNKIATYVQCVYDDPLKIIFFDYLTL